MAIERIDLSQLASAQPDPVAAAENVLRIRSYVDSLPDAEGTFTGHLLTEACENGHCLECARAPSN